jgi:hypothetical protein
MLDEVWQKFESWREQRTREYMFHNPNREHEATEEKQPTFDDLSDEELEQLKQQTFRARARQVKRGAGILG